MLDPRRRLPSVDALLRSDPGRRALDRFGRPVMRAALRAVLEEARAAAGKGPTTPTDELLMTAAVRLAARATFGLSPVINATGVVLHTNLGRAPLPEEAARAAARAARSPTDLEVDRERGTRGRRTGRVEFLLTALTGAEDALVVNNNAAALLLALSGLARRKEVVVSRGELIEIGGEFRLPDIMSASGAKLVEVGTTNRTSIQDYRRAMGPRTGLLLKVHPSNYRVTGFARSASLPELVALGRGQKVPLVHDLGSGLLARRREVPADEPSVDESLRAGADLVCFSGDKLLGGPQAGILLGRADLIERLRRDPLARALRLDKMTVAALEVVLGMYARGEHDRIPVWQMLSEGVRVLRARARALAEQVPGASVVRSEAVAGGGSMPGSSIPSAALRVEVEAPEDVAGRLRVGNPAVFCRVEDGALLLDLRTVDPSDDPRLLRALRYALG